MRLLYASPVTTAEIVRGLIDIFRKCQGMKKGNLLEKLEEAESSGDIGKKTDHVLRDHDYKLVRGLSELLMRMCVFEPEKTEIDPKRARELCLQKSKQEQGDFTFRGWSCDQRSSPRAWEERRRP